MTIIRGLSLTGPWDIPMCIPRAQGGKAAENRSRPIPKHLIGEYLALHTAQSFDPMAFITIKNNLPDVPLTTIEKVHRATRAGYIVAVTRVVDCVKVDSHSGRLPKSWEDQERWAFGPYVYLLEDLFVLPHRIPHKGALGFWELKPKALELTRAQWAKHHRGTS